MKNLQFAFIALCALAAGVSCQKDIAVQAEEVQSFTCVIAGSPDSKVSISDEGKTRWEPGDKIIVHGQYTGAGKSCTVTLTDADISADGKRATITFSGVTPYDRSSDKGYTSTYYAGYPADAVVNNEKCYYYTNFNNTNAPLMAAYNDGNTFVFYNLCGVISFKVSGDFDSYEFCGNSDETVGYSYFRTYLVQRSSGTPRLEYSYASDGGTTGPLTKVSGSVTADGSTVNYIGLPVGANFSSGFTFKFFKSGQLVKVAQTGTSVNVARSKLLALGDITSRLADPSDIPEPYSGSYLCLDEHLGQRPAVVAYLTEYTSASTLDATYLTHINYCHGRFGNPTTGDGGIVIATGSNSLMQKVLALKSKKPGLKVLLMIGGWGAHADGFSEMAKDPAKRTAFCQACKAHIDNYGFDGIDIDWEYPTQSADNETGCDPNDTQNFNIVLKELRETIGDTKIISFASSSSAKYVDWKTAIKYIDYVNVMTYDMGSSPNGHNSPLYKSSTFSSRSCQESIQLHVKAGVPMSRQNLGVPFYGKAEKNPTTKIYEYTVKYNEMDEILNKGTYKGKDVSAYNIRKWDDVAKVPYLTDASGRNYLSYDDPESVAEKGKFVLANGLFGAMFWEYRHDDSNHSLLKSLYGAIYPD